MRSISRNIKLPERRSYGLTLDDVRGLIRKPVSYWAIDESGNPSRKIKEDGKAFTLSAVTELSPIDYDRLLEGVPLYDGEVHFSRLRNEHPDICIRLITNFGQENILILYKTVFKKSKGAVAKKIRGQPVDELYLLSLLNEIIAAILEVDCSETVVILYDQNRSITEDACTLLWNDHCVLVMGESHVYRSLQMADLSASSIGRASLPSGFAEDIYFERIRAKSVDVRENREGPQHIPALLPHDDRDSEYLTDSELAKKSRISKNVKIGRRTETKSGPQHDYARLQPDARDSGYLTRSEQKRSGPAGCTQHPAFTHTIDASSSDYKSDKQPSKRKSSKKRRCVPRS